MPLLVGWLAVWYLVRHRRWIPGLATATASVVAFAVAAFVVPRHFAATSVDLFADRYAELGGSPAGLVKTLATDPGRVLGELATRHDLGYALILLAPFVGLWALSPLLAAGAVPELALDLLSGKQEQTQIMYQYSAAIAPFVVAAAVLGAARLRRDALPRVAAVVLGLMTALLIFSPLSRLPRYVHDLRSEAHAARVEAVSLVPEAAAVSATNRLGGHLSERRRILLFPTVAESRWIVVDVDDPTMRATERDRRKLDEAVEAVSQDPAWRRVFAREGILVFRKEGAGG
jgi:uncharacterized membrane protein